MDSTLIDVIVDNVINNPHCLHGPTLLFRKLKGKTKNYYACSACRSHKDCNFYVLAQDLMKDSTANLSSHWKSQQKLAVADINKENRHEKYLEIVKLSDGYTQTSRNVEGKMKKKKIFLNYCYSCCCLFTAPDVEHKECNVLTNLSKYQLLHPTEIVIPKTNTKTHAQYFFSETTVNDILILLKCLKISKVLCVGVPRVHECIINNSDCKMKSLLLDLDKNYFNFYSKDNFIWFNMFNNHVFDVEQKQYLQDYLSSEKIVILLDPPFGGRVEPLAYTLKQLSKLFSNEDTNENDEFVLDTFWFFPYFMEHHINRSLPNFKMFDYKVNYENHTSFTNTGNRKRKFGSPVRIFTNVSLSRLDLNGISGYKFCSSCGYWVSEENRHCSECNSCTSKDGRTYVHCVKCGKCVKPTYEHCVQCKRCCLPGHTCGEFQPDLTCYHCSRPGHKKNSCPELTGTTDGKIRDKRKKTKLSKRRRTEIDQHT